MNLPGQSLEVTSRFKDKLDLHVFFHQGVSVIQFSDNFNDDVEYFGQIFGIFELQFIFLDSIEKTDKLFVFGLYFYLHLGGTVSMTENGDN